MSQLYFGLIGTSASGTPRRSSTTQGAPWFQARTALSRCGPPALYSQFRLSSHLPLLPTAIISPGSARTKNRTIKDTGEQVNRDVMG